MASQYVPEQLGIDLELVGSQAKQNLESVVSSFLSYTLSSVETHR